MTLVEEIGRRAFAGSPAGEQFVQNETERIDVALDRHLSSGQLLGGHVGRRAGANLAARELIGEAGQAEVGDAHPALNGQTFSQPVTAERAYRAAFDLQEMKDLHVTVVPKGVELTTAGRGIAQSDVQVDIGVQKKLATGDDAEIDELMGLVQEIAEFIRATRHFEQVRGPQHHVCA
jgi:hypothetical protein